MTDSQAPVITDVRDKLRFEARIDGVLAGRLEYRRPPGRVEFTETQVDPAFGGRGIGSALVREALDAVRGEGGRKVVAICPFVHSWLDNHPDYGDLLA